MSTKDHNKAEQLQVLFETVEGIRADSFPDVPAELVRHILRHHADPAASETDLMRSLEKLVDKHMNG